MKKNGRPAKFKNAQEIEKLGMAYFKKCEKNKEPLTITGLALALDTTRQLLMEYSKKEQFNDTIKRLKTTVENYWEKKLAGNSPTGAIFALKNFGWKDKQEMEHKGQLTFEHYSTQKAKYKMQNKS